jgi:hypothetical protein
MKWREQIVWTPVMDAILMEMIANGCTFAVAADQAGVNKDQASARFYRLAKHMGRQAA